MKASLIAILLIVLMIPAVWFGVFPLWGEITAARAAVADLHSQIALERTANERLLALAESIEAREGAVASLEQTVPKERDVATLIAVFEEAASSNGLVLEGISMTDPVQGGEIVPLGPTGDLFESIASQITLTGTYPAVRSFLVDVEHSFPLVDVGTITFQLEQEEGQQGVIGANPVYSFEVVLTSYYLK